MFRPTCAYCHKEMEFAGNIPSPFTNDERYKIELWECKNDRCNATCKLIKYDDEILSIKYEKDKEKKV